MKFATPIQLNKAIIKAIKKKHFEDSGNAALNIEIHIFLNLKKNYDSIDKNSIILKSPDDCKLNDIITPDYLDTPVFLKVHKRSQEIVSEIIHANAFFCFKQLMQILLGKVFGIDDRICIDASTYKFFLKKDYVQPPLVISE